jgi:hypothetical protein
MRFDVDMIPSGFIISPFLPRTLELCNTEPGEYQLHLEAGELNLTKTLSLCVAGE